MLVFPSRQPFASRSLLANPLRADYILTTCFVSQSRSREDTLFDGLDAIMNTDTEDIREKLKNWVIEGNEASC